MMSRFKLSSLALASIALFSACGNTASGFNSSYATKPTQSILSAEAISIQHSTSTPLAASAETSMIEPGTPSGHKSFNIKQSLTRCMDKIKRIR